MEESAKSAERVRNDLQTFRNRSIVIDGQELCAICTGYLLVKPFFIFPCGHKFHHDCLEHQIMEHLSKNELFYFEYSTMNLLVAIYLKLSPTFE